MSVPVIIIIGGPRPNGRTQSETHEFDTVQAAIDYLNTLPPTDELPAGDGTSES